MEGVMILIHSDNIQRKRYSEDSKDNPIVVREILAREAGRFTLLVSLPNEYSVRSLEMWRQRCGN
jgi:hypothetical protein